MKKIKTLRDKNNSKIPFDSSDIYCLTGSQALCVVCLPRKSTNAKTNFSFVSDYQL